MKARAKYCFLFLLLSSLLLYGQTVNISGTVLGSPLSNNVSDVTVNILDAATNDNLASTVSDNNGNYSVEFTITALGANAIQPKSYFLSNAYPNPFNPSTNINFNTPKSGLFQITIFNILGERIFSSGYNISAGSNRFNISGLGSAGVYFFRISGKDFTKTTKLLLLDGGSDNTEVKLLSGTMSGNSSLLKLAAADSLLVSFSKDGYNGKDTTITIPEDNNTIILNTVIERIPRNTTSQITFMKITGDNLPLFPVHFVLGEKDSVYTSDSLGLVTFYYEDYNDPYIDSMKVYIDDPEDESPEDIWMGKIIVKENRPDANMGLGEIAQNKSIHRSLHEDLYVKLEDLANAHDVAMKFTPRFGMLGDGTTMMDMKDVQVSAMSNQYGDLNAWTNIRWERYEVKPGVWADTLYTIIQTDYANTDVPVPQGSIDLATRQLELMKNIHVQQSNGTKTLNLSKNTIYIKNTDDSLFQYIKYELELQNYFLVKFSRSGYPGNTPLKRDDDDIWKNATVILTNSSSPGTMISEMAAAMHGFADATRGVGAYFNVLPNFDKISEFGKIWATYRQECTKGEKFLLPPEYVDYP